MTHNRPKRALILMSHTGGGHRSVARAIERGLLSIGGGEIEPAVVDLFAIGTRTFLDSLIGLYSPIIVHSPRLWALIYHATNGRRRFDASVALAEPFVHRRIERLLAEHSPQVVVSVHPLANHIVTRLVGRVRPGLPVVTVLTDLIDVHAGWASKGSDLCIAPTTAAAGALEVGGVRPDRILSLGLPIGPRFGVVEEEVSEIRTSLGLSPDRFTALVVGGSEGAGGILRVVDGIRRSGLDVQLLVVCGKNEKLRRRLESGWQPASGGVFGYVENMPEMMHAADVVVTKAGSLSLAEAMAARRPVVIFKALPGQEQGNVDFVRLNEVGFVANGPDRVAEVLWRLSSDACLRHQFATNTALVRKPEAALEAARAIARLAGVVEKEKVAVQLRRKE
ncbi:MAG: glycosyltransferase [Chloroflexi bacterium]|nr:glycosyltransferase [Chloroflexota bacterium]